MGCRREGEEEEWGKQGWCKTVKDRASVQPGYVGGDVGECE